MLNLTHEPWFWVPFLIKWLYSSNTNHESRVSSLSCRLDVCEREGRQRRLVELFLIFDFVLCTQHRVSITLAGFLDFTTPVTVPYETRVYGSIYPCSLARLSLHTTHMRAPVWKNRATNTARNSKLGLLGSSEIGKHARAHWCRLN